MAPILSKMYCASMEMALESLLSDDIAEIEKSTVFSNCVSLSVVNAQISYSNG